MLHLIQLRYLLPGIMLVTMAADLTLRFVPIHYFTFRSWEALVRYHVLGAKFEANKHYYYKNAYGDLASAGNLPNLREYHSEVFTTDQFGFRNTHAYTAEADAVIFGDSFVVGNGVNDDETLSSQLFLRSGKAVYNAGAGDSDLDAIMRIANRVLLKKGYVIYEYMERDSDEDLPSVPSSRSAKDTIRPAKYYQQVRKAWNSSNARILFKGFSDFSPMRILAQRALKSLQNDRVLPNYYKNKVRIESLVNGDTMLFLPEDVSLYFQPRIADEKKCVEYWRWLNARLKETGLKLLVLLVPTKYTVYYDALQNKPASPTQKHYLDRLEERLKDSGVPVVNLKSVFITTANQHIDDRAYIYFKDDTHWNAKGISLAAEQIKTFITQ